MGSVVYTTKQGMKGWDLGSQFYRGIDHVSRHAEEMVVQESWEEPGGGGTRL